MTRQGRAESSGPRRRPRPSLPLPLGHDAPRRSSPRRRAPIRRARRLSAPGSLVRRGRRRLDEHDVLGRDADVVLPRGPLQLHRLRGAQRPGRHPIRRCAGRCRRRSSTSVPSLADSRRRPPKRTRPPSAANRCTCDAMGTVSPPANSSGSNKREYCEGIPASGRARTRAGMPEDARIGPGLLALVPDGLPVAELHRVQGAGLFALAAVLTGHRRRGPHGHAGPTRTGSLAGREATRPSWAGAVSRDPLTGPSDHPRPDRTPMRPINLPAYGKVEACPRSRRTSPSAA